MGHTNHKNPDTFLPDRLRVWNLTYGHALRKAVEGFPQLYGRPLMLHDNDLDKLVASYTARWSEVGGVRNMDLKGKAVMDTCRTLAISCTYIGIENFLQGKAVSTGHTKINTNTGINAKKKPTTKGFGR